MFALSSCRKPRAGWRGKAAQWATYFFAADGLHLIRHSAVEEKYQIHAYTRVKDSVFLKEGLS